MQKLVVLLLALTGFLVAAPATAQLYDVRAGEVNYNKGARPALKVQVDGNASDVQQMVDLAAGQHALQQAQ